MNASVSPGERVGRLNTRSAASRARRKNLMVFRAATLGEIDPDIRHGEHLVAHGADRLYAAKQHLRVASQRTSRLQNDPRSSTSAVPLLHHPYQRRDVAVDAKGFVWVLGIQGASGGAAQANLPRGERTHGRRAEAPAEVEHLQRQTEMLLDLVGDRQDLPRERGEHLLATDHPAAVRQQPHDLKMRGSHRFSEGLESEAACHRHTELIAPRSGRGDTDTDARLPTECSRDFGDEGNLLAVVDVQLRSLGRIRPGVEEPSGEGPGAVTRRRAARGLA